MLLKPSSFALKRLLKIVSTKLIEKRTNSPPQKPHTTLTDKSLGTKK